MSKVTNVHPTNTVDSQGQAINVATATWTENGQHHSQIIPMRGNAREHHKVLVHATAEESSKSLAKRLQAAVKYYQKASVGGVFLTPAQRKGQAAQA